MTFFLKLCCLVREYKAVFMKIGGVAAAWVAQM